MPPPTTLIRGRSARTIDRSEIAPVVPFGVARIWLAVCPVANASASVPEDVTGEPVTENTEGAVSATLDTPVPAGAAHAPAPLRNVDELQVPDQSERTFADVADTVTGVETLPTMIPADGPNSG